MALEGRLVETGEDPAGVGGLELGRRHRFGEVEPAQAVGETAGPAQLEFGLARRERLVERQHDALADRADGEARPEDASAEAQLDLLQLEGNGMQDDFADRALH